MNYATPADLARVATDGWDELAQRASRSPMVSGELLRLTYEVGDRSSYTIEQIALADTALALINDVLTRTCKAADAYLAPRYQAVMPLDADVVSSSDLPSAVATIALRRLYGTTISDELHRATKWADDYLRVLSSGKASLGIADTSTAAVPGRMQVSAPVKAFDWNSY